jgi:DNA helicase IV
MDRELQAEQAHVDLAYRRLDQLREETERVLRSVMDQGRGGTHQFREERDVIVRTSLARLDQLDIGDQALCFGRIDRRADDGAVEAFHIGRLGVSGEDLEPLVVDWRAPVAEPFYRATGRDPMGLVLRRHLAAEGRRLIGLEDERFDGASRPDGSGGADGVADGMVVGGPGALLAALDQARTGSMRDIVATIQREQDEIIRAPLAGVLVVQGGPGTGKTAVALHRAAYLLYTHRFPLERQGVLVIGPNPLFLRYIEQVLPSLGETGVVLATIDGLARPVVVRGTEPAEVARLKGDARMARVVARAVRTRQRALRRDVAVPFGATTLRLTAAASADVVAHVRRRPGTHNARRRVVEQMVARLLVDQYLERLARRRTSAPAWGGDGAAGAGGAGLGVDGAGLGAHGAAARGIRPEGPASDRARPDGATEGGPVDAPTRARFDGPGFRGTRSSGPGARVDGSGARVDGSGLDGSGIDGADGADGADTAELVRGILAVPEVREALDRMWPRLSPEELVHDLLGAPALVAAAGRGILTPAEQRSLVRPRSASLAEVPWTSADLALVDEARVLLGPRRGRAGDRDPSELRTYGHIVVDEAQDLSPMQLRMVARRSLSGSMTVVGDIGQATGPWAPAAWTDVLAHLPGQRPARQVELSVSYRTPAEVVAVAAPVLAAAAPGLRPPTAVRRTGVAPRFVAVDRHASASLADAVCRVAADLMGEVAPGTTAIVAPDPLVGELALALDAAGLGPTDPRTAGLGGPLSLLPIDLANGLEFDAVVLVEPAEVVAGSPQGLRALYVALTRPTRRLAVVHAQALPSCLVPTVAR